MSEKTVIIHQARMSSTRLPGKVMLEILGKPLLAHSLERLSKVRLANKVIVATSTNPKDDTIEEFCKDFGVEVFRGSEENVLDRFYFAAKKFSSDHIVRTTADCPIIDPKIVEDVISLYFTEGQDYDYASNFIKRSYPLGMSAECFSKEGLETVYRKASQDYEKSHVTPYFYLHPEEFHLASLESPVDLSLQRWTVDTPEDFEFVKNIISSLQEREDPYSMGTVLKILDENPEWLNINRHIRQKELKE